MYTNMHIEQNFITNNLISSEQRKNYEISSHDTYRQMSLFDDYNIKAGFNLMNNTDITNKTIYLCDDTIEGIFTAIYKAWDNNPKTTDVRIRSSSSSLSFLKAI